MSPLRKTIVQQGLKLLTDPRVSRWIQDERVMRTAMLALSVPGKAQTFAKEQLENLAKAMALATEDEVRDLRRTVRRLEDEVSQLRNDSAAPRSKTKAAE